MTFVEHKKLTARDVEYVAEMLVDLAKEIREGDLGVFEKFWWEGGTEEGDAKINAIRELLVIRYAARMDKL